VTRKNRIQTVALPPEAPLGLWPQLQITLRALEPWERPALGGTADDRMAVYARMIAGDMALPDWVGIYTPLANPDLLADFMRIFGRPRPPRDSQVIRFYREYGPLYLASEADGMPAWAELLSETDRRRLTSEARLMSEPVWWLMLKAREVARAYDLYLALKEDDPAAVRGLLRGIPEGVRLNRFEWQQGEIIAYIAEEEPAPPRGRAHSAAVEQPLSRDHAPSGLHPLADEEYCQWGKRLLADRLSLGDRGSRPGWRLSELPSLPIEVTTAVPGLVRSRTFDNLLAAMYLQLGEMVTRGEVLGECRGCGGRFRTTHRGREYCDRYCSDAARQRKARTHSS
jgi:hypothetical protein